MMSTSSLSSLLDIEFRPATSIRIPDSSIVPPPSSGVPAPKQDFPDQFRAFLFDQKPGISQEETFIKSVLSIITRNLANQQLSVSFLAQALCLSTSQTNRRIKSAFGWSSGKLIRHIRLQYAAYLLRFNMATISDIAAAAGYYTQASFCRGFKQQFGVAPSKYRALFLASAWKCKPENEKRMPDLDKQPNIFSQTLPEETS